MKRNLIFAATAAAMMLVASCTRGKETAENNNTRDTLSGQQSSFEQQSSAPAQADETIAESLPEEQPQEIAIVTEEEYKSLYAEKNDDPTKPKMIFVEGGAFRLGTNWQNYHKVTVSSFEIGETEVTFGLYYPSIGKEIDESRKDYAAANVNWYEAVIFCNRLSMKYGYEPCYTLNGETDPSLWGDEIPYFTESDGNVGDMAAWNAIQCNFNANGYRLPTDAEWCYAAQGGKKRKNTKYSGSDILDEVGWYEDNAKKDGQQVALKMPNELGIYDMSGNLWEWCWNKGGVYSKKTEVNPISLFDENNQRVIRGGGDGSPESSCEVTYTNSDEPNVKSWYYGFRLCRSIRKR